MRVDNWPTLLGLMIVIALAGLAAAVSTPVPV